MKRHDFIKLLESNGWYLKRHGSNHDVYTCDQGGRIVVPRHSEIKENLVRDEIRKWGLKQPSFPTPANADCRRR